MKKIALVVGIVFVVLAISSVAHAQGPCSTADRGPQDPSSQVSCMPVGSITMEQGIIIRDMMQLMIDMIKIQEKIVDGTKITEKKEIIKEMEKIADRIEGLKAEMRDILLHRYKRPLSMLSPEIGIGTRKGLKGSMVEPQTEPQKGE